MHQALTKPLFQVDQPIEEDPIRSALNRRVPWMVHDATFSQQSFGTGAWPDQGWKLHVSATSLSAIPVLDAALDVLLRDGARFKVLNSIKLLTAANSGLFGISQIGKFITVYPNDDPHAVRLAVELDAATRGLSGPRVPTDRALRPDSLVHYRYGAMTRLNESAADAGGESAYDMLDPWGRLTNDVRLNFYWPPEREVADPFDAAGVRVPAGDGGTLLNGRYFVCDALSQSARGGVFRAVDILAEPARICLLKEAWHDVGLDQWGRDARDWAANEAKVLLRHAGDPTFPRFYDRFEQGRNHYIAIEYIEGTPLDHVLSENHDLKHGIDPGELVAIGLSTSEALAHLHEAGLVFRDFKPANLLKTPDGGYRLIDFGIAYQFLEDDGIPLSTGTPPFYSKEQYEGERPCPAHDVFSWGAVLYHLAVGDPASKEMPQGKDFFRPFARRPLAELRPDFPQAIASVIDRAVAFEPANRFASMRAARQALQEVAHEAQGPSRPDRKTGGEKPTNADAAFDLEEALPLAREIGDALCAVAEKRGGGLCWQRRFEWIERTEYSPDLYAGAAGVGLFLAELSRATGEERYADAARGAARWICGPDWGRGRAQHGLHSGEAGVAFFLLRLAEILQAPGYVAAAAMRLRRLRGSRPLTIDLMYGTAGTVTGLLHLHAVTGESEFLSDARELGDDIVEQAIQSADGDGVYWEIASSSPGGPIAPQLGLLHGCAGVGLALCHLAAVTGDDTYWRKGEGAAELLISEAVPSVSNAGEAHLTWPGHMGDTAKSLQAHCHGAGGIGQFFHWLGALRRNARYRDIAIAAARAVASQRGSDTRSGLCHGLSGTGDLMLDCHQNLGGSDWLNIAADCAVRLRRFRVAERPGVYLMHDNGGTSPDLMLGYAGIGSFLLRLVQPQNATDLIFGPMNGAIVGRFKSQGA